MAGSVVKALRHPQGAGVGFEVEGVDGVHDEEELREAVGGREDGATGAVCGGHVQ